MKGLLKNIVWLFLIIIFSNSILDLGEEQPSYFAEPVRSIGITLVLSIVGGYCWWWVEKRTNSKSRGEK